VAKGDDGDESEYAYPHLNRPRGNGIS
jgi:hypothetical protein